MCSDLPLQTITRMTPGLMSASQSGYFSTSRSNAETPGGVRGLYYLINQNQQAATV